MTNEWLQRVVTNERLRLGGYSWQHLLKFNHGKSTLFSVNFIYHVTCQCQDRPSVLQCNICNAMRYYVYYME